MTQVPAYTRIDSPLGPLLAVAEGNGLSVLALASDRHRPSPPVDAIEAPRHRLFIALRRQLAEYFAGTRTAFDLPLAPAGTPFQMAAWNALLAIPYGTTRSYAEQAAAIRRPTAVRAIGAANGRNPIAIVIPCHRVIAADGSLGGYAGGLEAKRHLLAHEARHAGKARRPTAAGPIAHS